MTRRPTKAIDTDNEVHALLQLGKNMYQTTLAKNGRPTTMTMSDYLRAIVHDTDPEALNALRLTAQLHRLKPGEYDDLLTARRKHK